MRAFAACLMVCATARASAGDITIHLDNNADAMAECLLTQVGGPLFADLNANFDAAGFWDSQVNNYGLRGHGVVLCTGRATNYGSGPNSETAFTTAFGVDATDRQNELLAPATGTPFNRDAAELSFDFLAFSPGQRVVVTLVFGSEEWPEYVGIFNDGMAVYANGVNVAMTMDGQPIGVLNTNFATPPIVETELDNVLVDWYGSPRLRFAFTALEGVNTVDIIIGDAVDSLFDSTVYIEPLEYSPCFADLNLDGFVDGIDIDLFMCAFENGSVLADVDGDGFISGIDYDIMYNAFEAGC